VPREEDEKLGSPCVAEASFELVLVNAVPSLGWIASVGILDGVSKMLERALMLPTGKRCKGGNVVGVS